MSDNVYVDGKDPRLIIRVEFPPECCVDTLEELIDRLEFICHDTDEFFISLGWMKFEKEWKSYDTIMDEIELDIEESNSNFNAGVVTDKKNRFTNLAVLNRSCVIYFESTENNTTVSLELEISAHSQRLLSYPLIREP